MITAAAFLRYVMRRAIDDAPTIFPSASRIGDNVMDTSMRRPLFCTPTVIPRGHRPRTSRAVYPWSRSAPAFRFVTMP